MAVEFEDIKIDAVSEDVADLVYIRQIEKVALGVPRGSLPGLPDFGAGLAYEVDQPLNAQTIANIQSTVYEGLSGLVPDNEVTAVYVDGETTGTVKVRPVVDYTGDLRE